MAGSPSVGCVEQAYSNSPSTFNRLSWHVPCSVESGGSPPDVSAASQWDHRICRPPLGPRCGAQLLRLSTRGATPACKRDSLAGRSSAWRCLTGCDAIAPVAAHRAQADRSGSREHSHEAISPPLFPAELDSKHLRVSVCAQSQNCSAIAARICEECPRPSESSRSQVPECDAVVFALVLTHG